MHYLNLKKYHATRLIPVCLLIVALNAQAGAPKPPKPPKRPKALTPLYQQEHPHHAGMHFAWPVQWK